MLELLTYFWLTKIQKSSYMAKLIHLVTPSRIPRSENGNFSLRKRKFCAKKCALKNEILHLKIEFLCSENANFAPKTVLNTPPRILGSKIMKMEVCSLNMPILHSKTAMMLQTDRPEFCAQKVEILHSK